MRMLFWWTLAVLLAAAPAQTTDSAFESAGRKLAAITHDTLPPGASVSFSEQEVNAYVRAMLPRYVPRGVRNPVVRLGEGEATGSADVNFIELAKSLGSNPNRLLEWLAEGEYPLSVTIQVTSKDGLITVDLRRVTISGHTIEGAPLDFLVRNIFLARFPDARLGEPFALQHDIRRIVVEPEAVRVWVGP